MPTPSFESKKLSFKVGILGHADHGKTELTTAIVHIASVETYRPFVVSYNNRDIIEYETAQRHYVEYETAQRHYVHIDCPAYDWVKNMTTGAVQIDGAILVVAATDGPMPQTREHILLARQIGVARLIVFISKTDRIEDPEIIELIKMEVIELITSCNYPEDTPIITGSARYALENSEEDARCIQQLLDTMDSYFTQPAEN